MSSKKNSDSDNSVKNEKKKKSIIPKIFGSKRSAKGGSDEDVGFSSEGEGIHPDLETRVASQKKAFLEPSLLMRKVSSEREASLGIEGLNLCNFDHPMAPVTEIQEIRVFVATWNVGGKTPYCDLELEEFLLSEGSADLYVCGFQEIVPLNAGNVLVVEDNEPAAKWLALIGQALNKLHHASKPSDSAPASKNPHKSHSTTQKESKSLSNQNFFQKPSLKILSTNFRVDSSLLKACSCPHSPARDWGRVRRPSGSSVDPASKSMFLQELYGENGSSNHSAIQDLSLSNWMPAQLSYRLIASKQMVGIFLSVWAKNELVPHVTHLKLSSVGRGILGRLGNKGCIAVSMSIHQTSFCFLCSHLASGEKEGDEIRRNEDVAEILRNLQFSRTCKNTSKNPKCRGPEKIVDHDRIIWLGDLNYRVSLSYEETKVLLEDNNWDALLEKDQLNIEREAGRVFAGFREGRVLFAPTYKYSHNSDAYAGETTKSKKKRRTPAWCDRILWRGDGIDQLSYIRGESRFSDHRPVCAVFAVQVEVRNRSRKSRFRKGYSYRAAGPAYEDCIPRRHSFYD